jgi:hypothetical protein
VFVKQVKRSRQNHKRNHGFESVLALYCSTVD